ncbi:dephospho-CoA kinase [Wenyingzhuangia sp. IMCC45533]
MIVGLTGGIGSGKTTVLKYFEKLGMPCYVADEQAKRIMNDSNIVKQQITQLLGNEAYVHNKLNKQFIASQIFSDKKLLLKINQIVHPEVHKDLQEFVKNNTTHPYIIYESAILFENNNHHLCDKIIVVTAPVETRIKRVMERDNVTKEQVLARINHQMSDEEKIKRGDFVIENSNYSDLEEKVLDIHKQLTV